MFGIGGDYSKSDAEQKVDPVQQWWLSQLYSAGGNVMESQGGIGRHANDLLSKYMPGAEAGFGAMTDMASGTSAGQLALRDMLGENPWLEGQIGNLGTNINQQLTRDIMPAIRSGGVAAGSPGGSRAGIAEGLAVQGAQDAFVEGSTNMRAADLGRRQQAANQLISSMALGGQGAIQGAGSMYNLGMSPYQSAWLPLLMQKQLLGSPAILGEERSMSIGFDASVGGGTGSTA